MSRIVRGKRAVGLTFLLGSICAEYIYAGDFPQDAVLRGCGCTASDHCNVTVGANGIESLGGQGTMEFSGVIQQVAGPTTIVGGLMTAEMTVVEWQVEGHSPVCGNISFRLDPDNVAPPGLFQSHSEDSPFPARHVTYANIIMEWDGLPGQVLRNRDLIQIYADQIQSWPPINHQYTFTFPVVLVTDEDVEVFRIPANHPIVLNATHEPTPNPTRVSVGQSGRLGNAISQQPAVSSDGRFVAFASTSRNLVIGDHNDARDIFVRDRLAGTVRRVSVNSDGAEGEGDSRRPAISGSGQLIAYLSSAENLVADDDNTVRDVFVYHRTTRETRRVSVSSLGIQADGASNDVSISSDGRYVAFASVGANLVTSDGNGVRDIFVHELFTNQTTRVSVSSAGVEGDADSDMPAISADGRFVAFASNAENLVDDDDNGAPDIFVHDREMNTTTRVSLSTMGVQQDGFFSGSPSISADGRFVAFESDAENLIDGQGDTNGLSDIFVRDLQLNETMRMSISSTGVGGEGDHLNPAISADGRFVAFNSCSENLVSGDTNGFRDVFVRDRDTNETTLVSIHTGGGQGDDDSGIFSTGVAISSDGNLVVFESLATNLVDDDNNAAQDILMHDRQAATTEIVSLSGLPAEGNGDSSSPAVAMDGLSVAFASNADNLVPDDTNFVKDVFHRDISTGTTTRISVNTDGTQGSDTSDAPSLSNDGRIVAFESFANNLVDNDLNDSPDVFVHDRDTQVTVRVSVDSNGVEGDDMSFNSSLSSDGCVVAFVSYSKNLVDNDSNDTRDVFVHDCQGNDTTRVSVSTSGEQGNDDSGELRFSTDTRFISADGRYVAFASLASNLVTPDGNNAWDVFVRDRVSNETTRVSVGPANLEGNGDSVDVSISADGRLVAFGSTAFNLVPDDNNLVSDVFVHDRDSNTTRRVSVNAMGDEGDDSSFHPSISADGRRVAFVSYAANLVPDDTNSARDIFVCDLVTGRITRANLSHHGVQADDESNAPTISPDGMFVAYVSDATNLTSDDTNGTSDVFLYNRRPRSVPGDFDFDGDIDALDQAQFVACLNGPDIPSTSQCSLADFDGDGFVDVSDAAGFMSRYTGPAQGGGSISGTVWITVNNQYGIGTSLAAQPGIQIELFLNGVSLQAVHTNANSEFHFETIVQGGYDLRADTADGKSATVQVQVATGKTTPMHFYLVPERVEGIVASYAGIAIDTNTTRNPDLNFNGLIDGDDLRLLRLSSDPKDAPALALAEEYFGRSVLIGGTLFQPDSDDSGAAFVIGAGVATGETVSGSLTAELIAGKTPASASFEILEEQGSVSISGLGQINYQNNPKETSFFFMDLDTGRVTKGFASLELSGGPLKSPVIVTFAVSQGFVALAPHGLEMYFLLGATGTLPIEFPVYGGLAMVLGDVGKKKKDVACDTITVVAGTDPRCDFGGFACATEGAACALGGSCRVCTTRKQAISGGHRKCISCVCVKP